MTVAQLTLVCLRLAGNAHAHGAEEVRARLLAPVILREAANYDLDPVLLAAVAWKESSFNRTARGAALEIGYMQIKRGTRATKGYDDLSDQALMNPRLNFHLGARHLAHVRDVCFGRWGVTDPLAWLSVYSGRRCRSSAYSMAIVEAADRARGSVVDSGPLAITVGHNEGRREP